MSDELKGLIPELREAADVWGDDDGGKLYTRAADALERLSAERDEAVESMASALRLVADLRWALGDEGGRMQPELIEYARRLRKDATRAEQAEAERDALRAALLKCKTCALPTEVRDLVNAALRCNAARGGEKPSRCAACAGSGEDFNEGDPCHVCSGTGKAARGGEKRDV